MGVGSLGFINPSDTLLKFKIQFQNTGNYLAFKIRIVDTLDASFDVSTFRLLSTSHACSLLMPKPGILEFIFNDIMLPDSNSNELLSHGFINYSIELKNNLPYNTTIKNNADIYFDYNEPVSTNQTINTIGAVGIMEQKPFSFRLYPNPVNDMIYLELNDHVNSCTARIFDLQGRLIYALSLLITTTNSSLSTGTLRNGYYIIELSCKNGRAYKSFVKL